MWSGVAQLSRNEHGCRRAKGARDDCEEGFSSAPPKEQGETWSVKGQLRFSPRRMADDKLTEKLVRLAAECEATYDGWGTSL